MLPIIPARSGGSPAAQICSFARRRAAGQRTLVNETRAARATDRPCAAPDARWRAPEAALFALAVVDGACARAAAVMEIVMDAIGPSAIVSTVVRFEAKDAVWVRGGGSCGRVVQCVALCAACSPPLVSRHFGFPRSCSRVVGVGESVDGEGTPRHVEAGECESRHVG